MVRAAYSELNYELEAEYDMCSVRLGSEALTASFRESSRRSNGKTMNGPTQN